MSDLNQNIWVKQQPHILCKCAEKCHILLIAFVHIKERREGRETSCFPCNTSWWTCRLKVLLWWSYESITWRRSLWWTESYLEFFLLKTSLLSIRTSKSSCPYHPSPRKVKSLHDVLRKVEVEFIPQWLTFKQALFDIVWFRPFGAGHPEHWWRMSNWESLILNLFNLKKRITHINIYIYK